jgi:hypothetical protein
MSIQDDEIVNDPRLAAIRTALGHDHDDATGPQTLDDAIAALLLRHAEMLGALGEAEGALEGAMPFIAGDLFEADRKALAEIRDALTAIRKVTP